MKPFTQVLRKFLKEFSEFNLKDPTNSFEFFNLQFEPKCKYPTSLINSFINLPLSTVDLKNKDFLSNFNINNSS